MDRKKLIGEDAELYSATLGTAEDGDDVKDFDTLVGGGVGSGAGWWRIVVKLSAASGFPLALAAGDWFYDDGATVIMATGESAQQATLTELCEISAYTVSATKAEIDVTTLCDIIKASRAGKAEMTGSFEGVRIVGGTAAQIAARNAIISQLVTVIEDDGLATIATSWTKTEPSDTLLWFFAYLHATATVTDVENLLILPIRLTSFEEAGVTIDDKQIFNGAFKVDGSEHPQEYQRVIA